MEEEKTMSLSEALRIILDKVGNVRVPVREREIASMLDEIASDLCECINAIEAKANETAETEATEPEVNGDV